MTKYQMRAQVIKAMAHPIRLQILEHLLDHGETCVCTMVEQLDESQSSVSKHFAMLHDAGLLVRRKEGLQVFYSVKVPCIKQFIQCIDSVLLVDLEERNSLLVGETIV